MSYFWNHNSTQSGRIESLLNDIKRHQVIINDSQNKLNRSINDQNILLDRLQTLLLSTGHSTHSSWPLSLPSSQPTLTLSSLFLYNNDIIKSETISILVGQINNLLKGLSISFNPSNVQELREYLPNSNIKVIFIFFWASERVEWPSVKSAYKKIPFNVDSKVYLILLTRKRVSFEFPFNEIESLGKASSNSFEPSGSFTLILDHGSHASILQDELNNNSINMMAASIQQQFNKI